MINSNTVERAKAASIEHVVEARGIRLRRAGAERISPCPRCGGRDRFAINLKKTGLELPRLPAGRRHYRAGEVPRRLRLS